MELLWRWVVWGLVSDCLIYDNARSDEKQSDVQDLLLRGVTGCVVSCVGADSTYRIR